MVASIGGRVRAMRQHRCVVSDEAWAWMEPLLPSSAGRRGGRWRDHRQVIEAISWKYRTGSPWRELPERLGPWQTAYERLTRWSADGTWAKLLARAQADAEAGGWMGCSRRPRRWGGSINRGPWRDDTATTEMGRASCRERV